MDVTATVDAYVAAWNELDADRRAALLDKVFSEGGTYRDPASSISGRPALVEHIAAYQRRFTGTSMKRVSRVDAYDDVLRFGWAVVRDDETISVQGVDFVSIAHDGKIVSVTGFFGTLD